MSDAFMSPTRMDHGKECRHDDVVGARHAPRRRGRATDWKLDRIVLIYMYIETKILI